MFRGSRVVRLEIMEDGSVDLMKETGESGKFKHLNYPDVESALIVAKLLLNVGRGIVLKNKFEPQLFKEARQEFKRMEEIAQCERRARM